MKYYNVTFKPDDKQISIHYGATLLEAAGRAGIVLNAVCGGKGTCGKCVVNLEPDGREVLACRYRLESDIVVTVPDSSRFLEQKILEQGILGEIKLAPAVCKILLKSCPDEPAKLPAELNKTSENKTFQLTDGFVEQLKSICAERPSKEITIVCHLRSEQLKKCSTTDYIYSVIAAEQGDTTDKIYGLAVDVGTTTVVARLIDMTNAKCIATEAITNPQAEYGDDVIARIEYASGATANFERLHQLIINAVNRLIDSLCKKTGVNPQHIYEICLVGNTTMNHLLLKMPVVQLGRAPYRAFSLDAHDRSAAEMAVRINQAGNVRTVEGIAGFVGSDVVAAGLAVNICSVETTTLLVDIGTNGELIMANKDKLYAASCAAGPAFEGARISCGSRAVEGAIEAVVFDRRDIGIEVIGGSEPRSLCGSGLIDAAAVLLGLGIIDKSGRFVERQKLPNGLPENILSRLTRQSNQPAFVLAEADGQKITITQKDVRQLQLAKAAVRTGIKLLQKKIGAADDDIKTILLAGAFGSYIRRQSAIRIGLIPAVEPQRIRFVGNAAGSGAQMILLDSRCRMLAGELAGKIEYVEIANEPGFQEVFAEYLLF